jgi:hypothetical protein
VEQVSFLAKCQKFLNYSPDGPRRHHIKGRKGKQNNNVKTALRIYSKYGLQTALELLAPAPGLSSLSASSWACSMQGVKSLDKLFPLVC